MQRRVLEDLSHRLFPHACKRPKHNDAHGPGLAMPPLPPGLVPPGLVPLPKLQGVSVFLPSGPSTDSPRERPAMVDDIEEGEIPPTEFSRLDGEGRICPVVVVSLHHANEYARPFAIVPPGAAGYLPLSAQCYVYLHIRRMHTQVTDVVACVGASLMRRVLCARSGLSPWLLHDRFESLRPLTRADTQDVARYAVCIGLAHKVYGSRDDLFRASDAIMYLLQQSLTPDNVADMELELLDVLDFRI